jgi:hypothetical protein
MYFVEIWIKEKRGSGERRGSGETETNTSFFF